MRSIYRFDEIGYFRNGECIGKNVLQSRSMPSLRREVFLNTIREKNRLGIDRVIIWSDFKGEIRLDSDNTELQFNLLDEISDLIK